MPREFLRPIPGAVRLGARATSSMEVWSIGGESRAGAVSLVGPCRSVQRNEGPIVVVRIIGLAAVLIDDKPFGIAGASADPPVDIIFFVAAPRQPAFPVLKQFAADVAGERFTVALP